MKRLSLRLLVGLTIVGVLMVTGVIGPLGVTLLRRAFRPVGQEDFGILIRQVAAERNRWEDPAWQAALRTRAERLHVNLLLTDASGRVVLADWAGIRMTEQLHPLPEGSAPVLLSVPGTMMFLHSPSGQFLGSIQVAKVVPATDHSEISTLISLAAPMTLILLLCLLAAGLLGHLIISPLLALGQAAQQLARGETEIALPQSPIREVQGLIDSFGLMTAELRQAGLQQAAVEQERRFFISAISHDLRTPLFSLRAHLEGIQAGVAGTPEKLQQYVGNALRRVENLERLIADLLAYAKLEYLDQHALPEQLELGGYVSAVAQGAIAQAAAKGVTVSLEPPAAPCLVQADPNLLWRVFDNLLDNAVRHTPPGGHIAVRFALRPGEVQVSVEDSGPGIPEADVARLFTPLFQGEASRSKQSGGVAGLGLAIAQRVAAAHAGSITAANRSEGGARFLVMLPRL